MEWKPIETAPRDGTIVDLWVRDGYRICDMWWDDEDKCWAGWDDAAFTHWMPTPEAPNK